MQLNFEGLWWRFLILIAFGYLMGNINFAVIISKLKHKDITKMGSGNPGTLNMSRNFGLKIGVLTLLLDMVKGAVPTLLGLLCFRKYTFLSAGIKVSEIAVFIGGFSAVVGHIFPFWLKFKGGKGIATTIGVFVVIDWKVTVICGILAILFIMVTEMGSMGSFIATTPPAIVSVYKLYVVCFSNGNNVLPFIIGDVFALGIIILTWQAHKQNIVRLLSGEEHATNWLQMVKDLKYKRKLKKLKNKNNM